MTVFAFVAVLAILGFLCFSGPDGFLGPKHRRWSDSPAGSAFRWDDALSPTLGGYRFSVL